jgi:GTP diphosphokinase / guanosine-3',5'-bis(diphosphate) 3'-diphosphatase
MQPHAAHPDSTLTAPTRRQRAPVSEMAAVSAPIRPPALHGGPPDPLVAEYFPGAVTKVQIASFAHLAEELATYLPADDIAIIREAYKISDAAHLGQIRATGEPYISHPLEVASIAAAWKLDSQAIQAALLHDVLEDTGVTRAQLVQSFGSKVADLVDGLSKLDRLQFNTKAEQQAESFRKMLLAMARDVRVVLVKLADRLHNMRTLGAMPADKRRRIAKETMDIYVPIAHRLGLNQIYRELQDLAFASMHPSRYLVLAKAVMSARRNRREVVGKTLDAVKTAFEKSGFQIDIFGREKTLYGIYRKMAQKRLSFSQVLDIYGFRIVVQDDAQCYQALGVVHSVYKPVPGKFKDYIAIPKINGYQSLHTTVRGPYGTPVEFQIRTQKMHRVAEAGVAAHWLYKSKETDFSDVQRQTLVWMQSLLDIQSLTGDSAEFLENVKIDLFPDAVYVFTPKGNIIALPRGATALDFAYAVHTDVGNTCVAARINSFDQPLRTELRNGDVVEVLTDKASRPNPAWLTFARTGRARSEIRHALKSANRDEAAALGERLLAQTFGTLGVFPSDVPDEAWSRLLADTANKTRADVHAEIGQGKRLPAVVAQLLLRGLEHGEQPAIAPGALTISGTEGVTVEFARCCHPIPGDDIMAALGKGHGLLVHAADCAQAVRLRQKEPERWIDVAWAEGVSRSFPVRLRVAVRNDRGVLAQVAAAIAQAKANIVSVRNEEDPTETSTLDLIIEVEDRTHLADTLRELRRMRALLTVERVRVRASAEENV